MEDIRRTSLLTYLLVIQGLTKKEKVIKNNDLANILNISPASVSEMLVKLKKEKYLEDEFKLTSKSINLIKDFKSNFL